MDDEEVRGRTATWLRDLVIGQGLCPFARGPFDAGRVRLVVTRVTSPETLLVEFGRELEHLVRSPADAVETTLLIHPACLKEFSAYNDFLDVAEALVAQMGLEGEVQVASFHPRYRFAGTEPDAAENFTNRSPFPMLHLLREESVAAAIAGHPDVHGIPQRNIEHMGRTSARQRERWRRGDPEDEEV